MSNIARTFAKPADGQSGMAFPPEIFQLIVEEFCAVVLNSRKAAYPSEGICDINATPLLMSCQAAHNIAIPILYGTLYISGSRRYKNLLSQPHVTSYAHCRQLYLGLGTSRVSHVRGIMEHLKALDSRLRESGLSGTGATGSDKRIPARGMDLHVTHDMDTLPLLTAVLHTACIWLDRSDMDTAYYLRDQKGAAEIIVGYTPGESFRKRFEQWNVPEVRSGALAWMIYDRNQRIANEGAEWSFRMDVGMFYLDFGHAFVKGHEEQRFNERRANMVTEKIAQYCEGGSCMTIFDSINPHAFCSHRTTTLHSNLTIVACEGECTADPETTKPDWLRRFTRMLRKVPKKTEEA